MQEAGIARPPALATTGAGRPGDFGLYEYATSGHETTDALGGSRHDYRVRTYLTIQPGGCGTLVRWEALQQRWDEWDYCPEPDHLVLRRPRPPDGRRLHHGGLDRGVGTASPGV